MLTADVAEQPAQSVRRENKNDLTGGGRDQSVDLLGIGFGPSNLALAIALKEAREGGEEIEIPQYAFIEAKPDFSWHDGMLLPDTTMQISFLKDLVSLRNPLSRFSFINYLHAKGRLVDFINLKTFFPSRKEFHDYLSWAAAEFSQVVTYNSYATRIDWVGGKFEVEVEHQSGASTVRETVRASQIVVGAGIRPVLPKGVKPGPRVFHNHLLLQRLSALPDCVKGKFLVVGSGQSAAEVAMYLHQNFSEVEVHASFRRFGYSRSDDTPSANQIFDPKSVDDFYTAPESVKRRLIDAHLLTNYSAVDGELIEELFRREYNEKVSGQRRLFFHRVTEVSSLEERKDCVVANIRDLGGRHDTKLEVDAVIYATGFAPFDLRAAFGSTIDASAAFDGSLPRVERDYSLSLPGFERKIFLNGGVEHSHGLTSSLLSNVAIRSGDILRSAQQQHAKQISD